MSLRRKILYTVLCELIVLASLIMPVIANEDPVTLCIEKYQKEKGMSYDEAKKLCTTSSTEPAQSGNTQTTAQVTQSVSTDDTCIKKYMGAGLTYEDAKQKCSLVTASTTTSTSSQVTTSSTTSQQAYQKAASVAAIYKCGDIEKKIGILVEKLNKAEGQDAESIKKDIEALKIQLKSCEVKAPQVSKNVATGIKNSCDEVKILKESLQQVTDKKASIKELIAKGEMKESDLEPYYKDYSYLSGRLEKVNSACQQGKPLEESPCARLSKLEVIYKQIDNKLQDIQDEKSKLELQEKLASIAKEIATLKQKCKAESLKAEKIESLYDLEKAYRAKQKAIIEGTSETDMVSELKKIEDDKKKILEDFAQKMDALDARQAAIIKKLEIKKGEVILDDIKTKAKKVKVEIKDKGIEIESTSEGMAITDGNIQVSGDIPLEYADGMLKSSKSGKVVKIMPSEIAQVKGLENAKITEFKLVDEGKPEYLAKSEKKGKLLFFIPVTIAKEYKISAEDGAITGTNEPWYSAVVSE